jgi:tetratricopeptide (TPR) repeat protein
MRTIVTIIALLAAVVGLQAMQERRRPLGLPPGVTGNVLYVRSPEFMRRAALSYHALLADVYWIRAIQHYGGTKLTTGTNKQYDLLYPLLDLTTSLDPNFDIAYGFGSLFLAEPYPSGPGRPDLSIALLQKALRAQPDKWRFREDLGFIYYWWLNDYVTAADWFNRAGELPGAPNWLRPLAAVTLAQGGNLATSRTLWTEVFNTADQDWLRTQARFRLSQLDALDEIAALERVVAAYRARTGSLPQSWTDVIRVGYLTAPPADPAEYPLQLDAASGKVTLARDSSLNPLPATTAPNTVTGPIVPTVPTIPAVPAVPAVPTAR